MNIFFAFNIFLYNFTCFKSSEMEGNIFTNEICFGVAISLGILLGDVIHQQVSDTKGLFMSQTMILVCQIIMGPEIPRYEFYFLYITQTVLVGISYPLMMNL